jgi:putative hydrolase of the HAD superfamily
MSEPKATTRHQQQQLRAVFFDVDGTLWDSHGCAVHAMEIILQRFSPSLPAEEPSEVIRRFNAVFFDLPRREHIRDRRPFSTLKRFEALLAGYDVKKPGLAGKIASTYDSVRRLVMRQFLRPDAHRVLEELGRRGLQRGVIMNGTPAVQRHLIQTLGLEAYLEHVVLGEVEGYSKPDARLFKRALELSQVEPGSMLYVGDSPLTDVLGAARAGIPTVWFNTGRRRMPRNWPAPDFSVTTLSEVLDIAES